MSRDTKLYIEDILKAIRSIEKFIVLQSYEEFLDDERNQFAVMKGLEIIGEASVHVENDIKVKFPEIDWRAIIAVRNILVHEYFDVDLEVVWDILHDDLPALKGQIEKILE